MQQSLATRLLAEQIALGFHTCMVLDVLLPAFYFSSTNWKEDERKMFNFYGRSGEGLDISVTALPSKDI